MTIYILSRQMLPVHQDTTLLLWYLAILLTRQQELLGSMFQEITNILLILIIYLASK